MKKSNECPAFSNYTDISLFILSISGGGIRTYGHRFIKHHYQQSNGSYGNFDGYIPINSSRGKVDSGKLSREDVHIV